MHTNKITLCISHSNDSFPIGNVMDSIRKKGGNPVRIDSDSYPMHIGMGGTVDATDSIKIISDNWAIDDALIGAIWHKKNFVCDLGNSLEGDILIQATHESETIKNALISSITDVFWLDHPTSQATAENKFLQIKVAKLCGLPVPPTLFTNIPSQVVDFFNLHNGDIVAKMHTPLTVSMGKPQEFVYTSQVKKSHLEDLDSLSFSPMIFQKRIEKKDELRIAYVDGHCFPAKVNLSKSDNKEFIDWRQVPTYEENWRNYVISDNVKTKIGLYMASMNLKFGVIDMIVDTNDNYQFLEVNPAGEWGMLEMELGLPISQCIAETLIKYHR